MDRIGVTSYLHRSGFRNLIIDTSVDESRINYFRLYDGNKTHERQLVDIRVSETVFIPERSLIPPEIEFTPYEMINIEWLSARNPDRNDFDAKKPQLPGQEGPGLGIIKYCFNLLHLLTEEIYKDGFMDVPEHMHQAIMYSRKFMFFDPVHEAILRAVMRDLKKYSVYDITWGIMTGTVIEKKSGLPQVYDPCEQIYPVSRRLKKYFRSRIYTETFKKFYGRKRYYLDYEEMDKRRGEIISSIRIEDL